MSLAVRSSFSRGSKSELVLHKTDPWSLADALDRLAPPADEALAGAERARLHALAAHLPAALTRVVYLEAWIGQPRPRLDLIVKIDPRDRDVLAELVRSPALRDEPGWARVASFARAWAVPGSLLDEGIRAAWLEFDLDPRVAPEAALRAPRVFVDFTRAAQRGPAIAALASEVLEVLAGAAAPATLRPCLDQLPGGATLAYLCVLAGDGALPVVRACMVGLAGHLAAYLGAIGWRGALDVLDPLAPGEPVGALHLDLAPEVRPRIGLEYTFPRAGLAGGLRAPDAFLDELVARGWCTARNREALRAWPKQSVELLPHDVWHSRVTRQIAHVKLTCAPGEPVGAKAYLRTTFDLLAGGTLLRGRPQRFDGARAPSDGGPPPSAAATAAQPLDRPAPACARALVRPLRSPGSGDEPA